MTGLSDGTYETMVVDVAEHAAGGARVELVLIDGVDKGSVVAVHAPATDPLDLSILGVGAVLSVVDGAPSVVFDAS